MPWFAKTETFNEAFRALEGSERTTLLQAHKAWVQQLRSGGLTMASGFLVDGQQRPGGGGLLVFQATSYPDALALIQQDPLIAGGWVCWQLHQWIAAAGDFAVAGLPPKA